MTQLPRNCEQLVSMRRARCMPDLPVLISLIGPIDYNNLTLHAKPDAEYDWRAITDLEVEVFTSSEVPMPQLIRTLSAIAAVVPSRIILAFLEGPRVDCGESRLVFHPDGDFKLFDWLPMAIAPESWAPSQTIVKSLWAAIADGTIPTPYDQAMHLLEDIAKEQQ